jgi:hypothetical protein
MSFFQSFFERKPSNVFLLVPNDPSYYGAGCVFTDGKHVLCGYQPQKKSPGISGIGGMKNMGETYLETAFRETVEELFHVKELPKGLLSELGMMLHPRKMKLSKGYIQVFFSFHDLELLLKICKKKGVTSPLYSKVPKTLEELIQQRQISESAELSHLCLLPVVKHEGDLLVNPCFLEDLREMAS